MNAVWSLALGLALLVASNGQLIAPFATVPCIPFLLRFLESNAPWRGTCTLGIGFLLAGWVMWWGVVPLRGGLYFAAASAYGLAHCVPYIAHRLISGSNGRLASTLVFPSFYVITDAALDLLTPYGSWSSISYAFPASSGVAQLSAVGGLPLVTFAIALTGSVLAWAWRYRALAGVAWPLAGMAIAASTTWLLPEARTRFLPAPLAVVQVATLNPQS